MAYSTTRIAEARAAYVYEALHLEGISRKINIPIGTIRRWKDVAKTHGDDWDRARAAARLSKEGAEAVTAAVMEDFVLLFQSTLSDIKNSADISPLNKAEVLARLSDAYVKTMSAITRANPKLDRLGFAVDLLRDLVQFIQSHYPQHAASMEEILLPFGESIGKRYG